MSVPKVFKASPTAITVEKGKTYAWCTCGFSSANPLCDGSHKTEEEALGFKSLKFTPEEDGEVWLCNCKQTKNPPYCDGSHKTCKID
jgi:CDGSH-type Zn-finger protein